MDLSPLFKEFKFKNLTLKNRFVMAPMTRSKSPNGIPTQLSKDYYTRRADGDVGLIITEGVNIDRSSSAGYPDVPVIDEGTLSIWQEITSSVHQSGGKIAIQLWHVGCIRSLEFDKENKVESVSPSGVYPLDSKAANHQTRSLELSEVEGIVNSFAEAAANAKKAGFDAIEIHAAHGYLIDQFFWDVTNKRQDKYGGQTLGERTRFAVEIVKACREQVGTEFPIILRFSNWKLGRYEQNLFSNTQELEEFIKPLSNAGVDIFHASSRNYSQPEFEGSALNLAGWTQKISQKPTITVGSVGLDSDFISSFKDAENSNIENLVDRMSNDEFDLVAVGRALLGEPNWVKKVKENNFDSIIPYTKESLEKLY